MVFNDTSCHDTSKITNSYIRKKKKKKEEKKKKRKRKKKEEKKIYFLTNTFML